MIAIIIYTLDNFPN